MKKNKTNKIIYFLIFVCILTFCVYGIYNVLIVLRTKKISHVSSQKEVVQKNIIRQNLVTVHGNEAVIYSPDNLSIATYFHKIADDTRVDTVKIVDSAKQFTREISVNDAMEYMADGAPLFWSPLNNRMYFAHRIEPFGIYELWSATIDGGDQVRIAGVEHDKISNDMVNSSPLIGVQFIDFSFDGKLIVTAKTIDIPAHESQIWIMDSTGKNQRKIISNTQIQKIVSVHFEKNDVIDYSVILDNKIKDFQIKI